MATPAGRRRVTVAPVLVVLIGLLLAWPLVRLVANPPTPTVPPAVAGEHVIVVGIPRLDEPDPAWPVRDSTQLGPLAAPGCPAATWASLGSGRPVSLTAAHCTIRATELGVVAGWADWQSVAPGLGTLGDTLRRQGACVGAVGPGGALAAAGADGFNAAYQSVDGFVQGGYLTDCPLTLVDAADQGHAIVTALLRQPATTVMVLGTGGAAGSVGRQVAVLYPAGSAQGGQLVPAQGAASPLEPAGLTAALITAAGGQPPPGMLAAWQVRPGPHPDLAAVAAREAGRRPLGIALLAVMVVLLALGGLVLRSGRDRMRTVRTLLRLAAISWPAAALIAAAMPWWPSPIPLGLGAAVPGTVVLGAAAAALARWWRVPLGSAAVIVSALALTLLTAATGLSPYRAVAPLSTASPAGVDPLALGGCLAAWLMLAAHVAVRRLGDAGRAQPVLVVAAGVLGLGLLAFGLLLAPGAAAWQVAVAAAVAGLVPLTWLALGAVRGLTLPLSGHVGLGAAAVFLVVLLGAPLGAWSMLAGQVVGLVPLVVLGCCLAAWVGLFLMAGAEFAIAPAALAVGVLLLGLGPWCVLGVTLAAAGVLVGSPRRGECWSGPRTTTQTSPL